MPSINIMQNHRNIIHYDKEIKPHQTISLKRFLVICFPTREEFLEYNVFEEEQICTYNAEKKKKNIRSLFRSVHTTRYTKCNNDNAPFSQGVLFILFETGWTIGYGQYYKLTPLNIHNFITIVLI